MPPKPEIGDKVRVTVTYEGEVLRVNDELIELDNTGGSVYLDDPDGKVNVEILETKLIPGQVYEDDDGDLFVRTEDGRWKWLIVAQDEYYADDFAKRPLTRLVPEGEK